MGANLASAKPPLPYYNLFRYRESLSDCVGELWMPHLGLFVPCANRKAEAEGFAAGVRSSRVGAHGRSWARRVGAC